MGLAAAAIAAVAFLSLRKPPEATGSGARQQHGPATPPRRPRPPRRDHLGLRAGVDRDSATATATTAAKTERVVRIETEPAGVAVAEDGKEICPSTPCDVTFKEEGGPTEHKLALTRKGYKGKELVVSATDTKASAKLDSEWKGGPAVVAPNPGTGQPPPPRFDACFDDSDCRGGRSCVHGFCK